MGLRSRRGAARAGSNLGHFPEQFEPNSTTLYIIRPPAHRRPSFRLARTHARAHPLARALQSRAASACAGRGPQSAGRTCANKIDFLSARWRFVTSLFTSPGVDTASPTDRRDVTRLFEFMMFPFTYQFYWQPAVVSVSTRIGQLASANTNFYSKRLDYDSVKLINEENRRVPGVLKAI